MFRAFKPVLAVTGILLFSFCANKELLVSNRTPPEQWERLQATFKRPSSFQGEGVLKIKTSGHKNYSAEFSSVAIGDSLLRVDVFHPLGGNIFMFCVIGSEYKLTIPSQNIITEGKYTDSLFYGILGVVLPKELIRCVFTATPFVPKEEYDSIARIRDTIVFIRSGFVRGWELKIKDQRLNPESLLMKENQKEAYQIIWGRYKNKNARRAELQNSQNGNLRVDFNKIRLNQSINQELFRSE
jgi:hypothetical protein